MAAVVGSGLLLRWNPGRELPPDPAPPDPRLSYDGPHRNVRPDVGYVGDAACRVCHVDVAHAYARHPMGRSLAPVRDALGPPPHDARGGRFEALNAAFLVERHGQGLRHTIAPLDADGEPIDSLVFEVAYVVGSGTRGFSYLAQRGGTLSQTPVSWFSQKGIWNLSPGFTPEMIRGRPIGPDCLYCHANRTRPVDGTVNTYQTPPFDGHAIGCERCHGPGELHARERSQGLAVSGPADYSIVNPGKLAPDLREAVCQQCHLAGEIRVLRRDRSRDDFRPGMPLDLFLTILVPDREDRHAKAVNHVEQMVLSRCFERSSGKKKLGCISCHDPHSPVAPDRRIDFYRGRCLECHRDAGCSKPRETRLKESPRDDCVGCHMPRYSASDIPHVAATDHRIVRRPGPPPGGDPDRRIPVPFGREAPAADDPGLARDLGVGFAQLAAAGKGNPPRLAGLALELLAPGDFAGDVAAQEARGHALIVLGRKDEALADFEKVLEAAPRRETALHAAALLAQGAGQRDKTLAYWRRLVEVNPWQADYRANLATVLAHARDWPEAHEHCRAWVRLDPGSRPARELWVRCLRQKGDREAARAQEKALRRLQ